MPTTEPHARRHAFRRHRQAALTVASFVIASGSTAACQGILGIQPPTDRDSGLPLVAPSGLGDGGGGSSGTPGMTAAAALAADGSASTVDSSGGAVGFDGGPVCGGDELFCNGACVSQTDVLHCGSCTHDCTQLPGIDPTSLACSAGECTYSCDSTHADCTASGAGCLVYLGDSLDCNACGATCSGASPYCAPSGADGGFACVATCPSTTPALCDGACVDLMTDNANCGSCGFACPAANTCQGGACTCLPCVLDQSNFDQCCFQ